MTHIHRYGSGSVMGQIKNYIANEFSLGSNSYWISNNKWREWTPLINTISLITHSYSILANMYK